MPSPPIPDDVLEEIFLACVHWYRTRISPLTLAAVCRNWRHVSQCFSRLWTDIDMSNPAAAEYYARLSGQAALDVTWCQFAIPLRGVLNYPRANDAPWMRSEVPRIRTLAIHSEYAHPSEIFPIFSPPDPESVLPRLKALVLAFASEDSNSSWLSFSLLRLRVRMPSLRHITLWNYKIAASDFLSLFRNSPLLQSASLSVLALDFKATGSGNQTDMTAATELPLILSHMRQFDLRETNLETQAFFLERLSFPADCTFSMVDYRGTHAEARAANLLSTFTPTFTHCTYDGEVLELTEGTAPLQTRTGRCGVRAVLLRDLTSSHEDRSRSVALLLRQVHTLTMVSCGIRDWTSKSWEFFTRFCPDITTVVLHGSDYSESTVVVPPTSLPKLNEVRWVHTSYAKSAHDFSTDINLSGQYPERLIATQIQARNASSAANRVSRISRVTLYERSDRPLDERAVSDLRREVCLLMCREGGESESTRTWRERDSREWWPTRRPQSLRTWLSATSARCVACNGYWEMHAREEELVGYREWDYGIEVDYLDDSDECR